MVNAHVILSTDPSVGHPPHYFHELPHEDEERLENLFKSLDVDGNGKIDIHDLSVALHEFGVHHKYAQVFPCFFLDLIRRWAFSIFYAVFLTLIPYHVFQVTRVSSLSIQ